VSAYERIGRFWRTVRYLRPSQIASRIALRVRAAGRTLSPGTARVRYAARAEASGLAFAGDPWRLRGSASIASRWISLRALASSEQRAADAAQGTFAFLNDRRSLGDPIDWTARGASQLWRYHLHYFEYLSDLLIADRLPVASSLMMDWIARVPMADASARDAWHPYVVSVRLVNWMLVLATAPAEFQVPDAVVNSLRIQTVFVRRNLERDVGGNHLLKNLQALAIAGCFWEGESARELREQFTTAFVRALEAQLRTDGGHYEQSPMYHAQVLGDAIELALALRRIGGCNLYLEALVERMADFLPCVVHPDGQLAQFGDTAAGMTPEPQALLAAVDVLSGRPCSRNLAPRHALLSSNLAEAHEIEAPPVPSSGRRTATANRNPDTWDSGASGFVSLVTGNGQGFLIADAGPVCPDDLPAHAHSDVFGFEVSVDSARIIVDSGVSEYAAGVWRDYYRSTRAHNTLMIDGVEQSECYSSFRVGRRARVIDGRVERAPNAAGFSASHTGFDHLSQPVRHRRRFLIVAARAWIVIDDLSGHGSHRWETFLHIHPEVELEAIPSGFIARRGRAALGIAWFGMDAPQRVMGQQDPLQGWYAPAFGRVLPSPTLVGIGSGPVPARLGWLLVPAPSPDQRFRVSAPDATTLVVEVGTERYDFVIDDGRPIQAGDTIQKAGEW
jgi:uncharacterized heparinase superfamily protein